MVLVGGGSLIQGSEDFYPEEQPIREVAVGDLLMDVHTVTNAEFRRFVKDTGHVTIAEQAPDPADFPDADPQTSFRARWCSHRRPARSRSTIGSGGGVGSPGPTGGTRKDPAARSTAGTGIRWCTSPTTTPPPTRLGGQASAH